MPRPGKACTSVAGCKCRFLCCAAVTTAFASGCSLPTCKLAASSNTASASTLASVDTARHNSNCGWPEVRVPVLSKATVLTACARSSASASLIRMPCCAATPVPTIIAVGVARPSAHGQAITNTATALSIASCQSPLHTPQPSKVRNAITITTGTNTALTLSTRRWIGAFFACADSTRRTMRASTDSAPIAVVRTCSRPSPLTAPPVTWSPGILATGKLSPLIKDSST